MISILVGLICLDIAFAYPVGQHAAEMKTTYDLSSKYKGIGLVNGGIANLIPIEFTLTNINATTQAHPLSPNSFGLNSGILSSTVSNLKPQSGTGYVQSLETSLLPSFSGVWNQGLSTKPTLPSEALSSMDSDQNPEPILFLETSLDIQSDPAPAPNNNPDIVSTLPLEIPSEMDFDPALVVSLLMETSVDVDSGNDFDPDPSEDLSPSATLSLQETSLDIDSAEDPAILSMETTLSVDSVGAMQSFHEQYLHVLASEYGPAMTNMAYGSDANHGISGSSMQETSGNQEGTQNSVGHLEGGTSQLYNIATMGDENQAIVNGFSEALGTGSAVHQSTSNIISEESTNESN